MSRRPQSHGKRHSNVNEAREDGGALAFTLIAMTAVLAIAASAMYMAVGSQRVAARSYHAKNAFFCAEMALQRARPVIQINWADRNTALAGVNPPAWYTGVPMTGNCSGPGNYTYTVTIQDDVDEFGAAVANPAVDVNNRIFVHAEVFAPVSNAPQARISALMLRPDPVMKGYK